MDELRAFLAALVESSDDAIIDLDSFCQILSCVGPAEFLQHNISDLIATNNHDWHSKHLSLNIHCSKDSKCFDAETSLGRFNLKGRKLQVMIVRDISDRRHLKERGRMKPADGVKASFYLMSQPTLALNRPEVLTLVLFKTFLITF